MSRANPVLAKALEQYARELNARSFEDAAVKKAKLDVMGYLISFDNSPEAPAQLEQINQKLDVLDGIKFGDRTGVDIGNSLTALQEGGSVQFKESSFVKNFIDGLLKLFGLHPYTHFDDVINTAKALLEQELKIEYTRQTQIHTPGQIIENSRLALARTPEQKIENSRQALTHTPDQIAEFPSLSPASLGRTPREATPEGALRDISSRATIGGERLLLPEDNEDFLDPAYKMKVATAIDKLTATLDKRETPVDVSQDEPFPEKSYAREVFHVSPQGLLACFQLTMLSEIPALKEEKLPSFGNLNINWGVDEKGLYCDCAADVTKLTAHSSGEIITYLANSKGELKKATTEDLAAQRLAAGKGEKLAPIVEMKARVRYTADPKGQIEPQAESFTLINHHPEVLSYSDQAYRFLQDNNAAHALLSGPPWTHEAGHSPATDFTSSGLGPEEEEEEGTGLKE